MNPVSTGLPGRRTGPGSHTEQHGPPRPEPGGKHRPLPASHVSHFKLIFDSGVFEPAAIDGCKLPQSFTSPVFMVCDVSGLLHFNELRALRGSPLRFITGFKFGNGRTQRPRVVPPRVFDSRHALVLFVRLLIFTPPCSQTPFSEQAYIVSHRCHWEFQCPLAKTTTQ